MLRVLFLGTPAFACPALAAVHKAGHTVVAAVCQPDKPAGRGQQLTAPPIKPLAESLGIPVLQPRRIRRPEVVAELRALAPDVIVTAAFGQILSADVLAVPRLGALNVHASLLPRWRGAAPIHRAVLAGDPDTGITIMWMDEGLDTGDMMLRRPVPIGALDTTGSVHDRLAALGGELIVQALGLVEKGTAPRVPQDHSQATYAHKLTRADEWLDWSQPAAALARQVRGLHPWPVAYTDWNGGTLKVWQAVPWEGKLPGAGGVPGAVVGVERGRGPLVATGDGVLLLTELQPEGKRRMDGVAFLAGHKLEPGTRLGLHSPPAEHA